MQKIQSLTLHMKKDTSNVEKHHGCLVFRNRQPGSFNNIYKKCTVRTSTSYCNTKGFARLKLIFIKKSNDKIIPRRFSAFLKEVLHLYPVHPCLHHHRRHYHHGQNHHPFLLLHHLFLHTMWRGLPQYLHLHRC